MKIFNQIVKRRLNVDDLKNVNTSSGVVKISSNETLINYEGNMRGLDASKTKKHKRDDTLLKLDKVKSTAVSEELLRMYSKD